MKVQSNKIIDIIKHYEELLLQTFDVEESKQLIRFLIEDFTDIPRQQISLNFSQRISESQILKIHFGVKDLLKGTPLQYILQKANFLDWEFKVNEDVLIPRPETEEFVTLIHESIDNKELNIIDIGTGSGCIAIALQKLTNANVSAVDISKDALVIAKQNAKDLNAEIKFIELNILDKYQWGKAESKYDLIVSNPPYVRESEKKLIQDNVLHFEPGLALFVDDKNPLVFYNAIANFALNNLKPNGELWFEINEYLGSEMKELLKDNFSQIEIIQDFRGKDRFCTAVLIKND